MRRKDLPEIVGHDHGSDHRLAGLKVRIETYRAPGLAAPGVLPLVHSAEVADGGEGIHPVRHLLGADLVVGRHECGEGRVSHKACPPRHRLIGDVRAHDVGSIELLHVKRISQAEGRGRVAEAVPGDAAVADRSGGVLAHDSVQKPLCAEAEALVDVALPVVHLHVVRLLAVEGVVHGDAPGRAARVGAEGAEGGARLRAGAACGADPRRVLPGDAWAIQLLGVRARRLNADPV
mmetsp:Transcript_49541/g.142596  ORF Transcript_49541/g.142596 Transcript_49541/m.142596 type:complete len:234 (+) Transcript_49541:332-1033(+)